MPNETDSNEMIDLDFDMADVDLSRPVLVGGTYEATIAFTRKSETRAKNLPQIEVGYRLAQTAQDTKGNTVNPGFTLTQRIITQPIGGLTQKMINERLGAVHFAATGAKTGKPNTGDWVGKPVRIAVALREARKNQETGEEYPPSNEVSRVYPPAKEIASA